MLIVPSASLKPTRPPSPTPWNIWPLPPLIAPLAFEFVIEPKLNPTRPPAPLPVPLPVRVALPVANELAIVAPVSLRPTRPPMKLLVPPATLPLASEFVMVPGLSPTRPPALLPCEPEVALPTVTFTAACALLIVPRLVPGPRMPFWPTRPPAMTPLVTLPFDTVPLTVTLSIVPPLVPARMPTNWPGGGTFGFAVTFALVMLRLRTIPPAPIAPNMPTFWVVASVGAMVRLLIVWPRPSSTPVKRDEMLPIGAKFGMPTALISLPSA